MSTQVNTATIAANETDETNKTVTIAVAPNRTSMRWNNKTYSIDELFKELSDHRTLDDKNTAALFTQGSLIRNNYNRGNDNSSDVNLLVLDIDNKKPPYVKKNKDDTHYKVGDKQHVSLEKAKSLIEASGFKAIIYTSHSHSEMTHRFRVVLPMAQSYALDADAAKDTYGMDTVERKNKWKYVYRAISAALEFTYDESGERYSQAFYFPSHPAERADIAESFPVNNDGGLLDWRDYEDAATTLAIAGSHAPTERKNFIYEGFNLRIWYEVYGGTYDIVRALEAGEFDVIGKQNNDGGYCLTPCPFHEEESEEDNPSESKTAIYNPDGNGGKFGFNCMGEHCADRKDPVEYLMKMLVLKWQTLEDLQKEEFGGGSIDPVAMANECDTTTPAAKKKAILRIVEIIGEETVRQDTYAALKKHSKMTIKNMDALAIEILDEKHEETKDTFSHEELKIKKRYKYITEAGGYYDTFLHYVKPAADIEKALYDKVDAYDDTPEKRIKTVLLDDPDTKFDKTCYRPGNHAMLITEEVEDHEGDTQTIRMLNTWRPSRIKPQEGDVTPIMDLIEHFFLDKRTGALMRKEMDYLLDTFAYLVQKPHIKQKHAIVLMSKPGAGKGTLFKIMKQIVGKHNYVNPSPNEINKSEHGFLEGKQLAVVAEAMSGDNRKVANDLKEPITDTPIRIRKLYRDAYEIDNPALIILCSNFDNPIYIELHDRRCFVHKVMSENKDTRFFDDLYAWIDNGGASIFMHYLQARDLKGYNPHRKPPMTQAKRELQQSSQGDAYAILQDKWDAKEAPFDKDVIRLLEEVAELKMVHQKMSQGVLKRFIRDKDGDLIRNAGISYKGYDNNGNPNGKDGTHRLWAVRDLQKYQEAATNNDQELIGKAMVAGYSKRPMLAVA